MTEQADKFDFAADARELVAKLSAREREVLVLGGKGFSTAETAAFTGLSFCTVQGYRKGIYMALGVTGMVEAAVLATKAGLL